MQTNPAQPHFPTPAGLPSQTPPTAVGCCVGRAPPRHPGARGRPAPAWACPSSWRRRLRTTRSSVPGGCPGGGDHTSLPCWKAVRFWCRLRCRPHQHHPVAVVLVAECRSTRCPSFSNTWRWGSADTTAGPGRLVIHQCVLAHFLHRCEVCVIHIFVHVGLPK